MPDTHTDSLSFAYIETSIPAGMTIAEFRAGRPRKPRGLRRLVQGLRPAPTPAASASSGPGLNPEIALPGHW